MRSLSSAIEIPNIRVGRAIAAAAIVAAVVKVLDSLKSGQLTTRHLSAIDRLIGEQCIP